MAIRKISRLQHRRGIKSDLPLKLHEGEFGWCLDTRELYIGNSDGFIGNSQILTEWTPNDRLINHAYQGHTGVASTAIPRGIGSILDDFMTVRDYGAVGNGVVDDYASLQQTIVDCYGKAVANGYSQLNAYVTVYVPAGTYRITEPLKLYPYVRLQGEGANRTKIILDSQLYKTVLETVDSHGNTAANIGLDSAVLPTDIDILDLWLDQPANDGDGIRIYRASNIRVEGCKITGPRRYGSNATIDTNGITVQSLGTVYMPNNIIVHDCEISGMGSAVAANDPVTYLRVDLCYIHNCWKGVMTGSALLTDGPIMTKVSNSVFHDIDAYGIGCFGANPGITSIGNSFNNAGSYENVPAVYFESQSKMCSSIGDQFYNCDIPIVNANPTLNIVVNSQKVAVAEQTPDLIGPVALLDNKPVYPQDTTLVYDLAVYNTINISYSMNRDTNKRTGRLSILTNGTTAIVQDEYSTLGSELGITFGWRIDVATNSIIVTYLSTITGFDATMYYTESKWYT